MTRFGSVTLLIMGLVFVVGLSCKRSGEHRDGRSLMIATVCDDSAVSVMDVYGKERREVIRARDSFFDSPSLDPSGKWIAVAQHEEGTDSSRILIINASTGSIEKALQADSRVVVHAPIWSPDSQKLAFTAASLDGKPFSQSSPASILLVVADRNGEHRRTVSGIVPIQWLSSDTVLARRVVGESAEFVEVLLDSDVTVRSAGNLKLLPNEATSVSLSPDRQSVAGALTVWEGTTCKVQISVTNVSTRMTSFQTSVEGVYVLGVSWLDADAFIVVVATVQGLGVALHQAAYIFDVKTRTTSRIENPCAIGGNTIDSLLSFGTKMLLAIQAQREE